MVLIAHRGASGYRPENTIAAFKKAVEMGSKAFEFDLQLTKDEKVVVFHDYTLERCTNGKGKLREKTLAELKKLDNGSWFDKEYINEKIPTLVEVIEVVKGGEFINLELKRDKDEKRSLVDKVLEVVKMYKIEDKALISSFDHSLLEEVYSKNPKIKIGVLFEEKKDYVDYVEKLHLEAYSINLWKVLVSGVEVEEIKKNNYKLYSFTVNEKEEGEKLREYGVDGIFTNYLDIFSKNSDS